MSWRQTAELKGEQNAATRFVRGLVRRLSVTITKGRTWQLLGHTVDGVRETISAEVFGSIGFASRPHADDRAEALLVAIGDSRHVAIAATRNEDSRKLHDAAIKPNTAAMFNRDAIVIVTDQGKVEARTTEGTALALPTMADFEELRAKFNALRAEFVIHGHTGGSVSGGAITATVMTALGSGGTSAAADAPAGTQVFRTE